MGVLVSSLRESPFVAAPIAALSLIVMVLLLSSSATAQQPSVGLSEAESRAEVAAADVEALEGDLVPVQARLQASSRRAAPVKAAANAAEQQVAQIEAAQRAERLQAAAEVNRIEAGNREAAEKHDEKVDSGLGWGLAAVILAAIALAWGWFRASAAVAALVRISLGQAIALCVGGGFLVLVIGGAMHDGDGFLAVVGTMLIALGLVLPVAFLLARHSAEVQRGRSRAILRRERLPARVGQSLGAVLVVLGLIGFGSAAFAGEAESKEVSSELRLEANETVARTPALLSADRRATALEERAASLLAVAHGDRLDLRKARRRLGGAEARMARAESSADSFTRQLVALEAREQREVQAEEREAAKAAEAEAREVEAAAEEEAELTAEECDPNYSGCLDPNASDYDCSGGSGDGPLYTGEVQVLGVDHYGLDEEGDGIGCEGD